MMNLKSLLKEPLTSPPKWFVWGFIALSFTGFLDSSYLTAKHFLGETPNCSFLKGCATVTTSQYSEIWGIPIALIGASYYLLILILSIAYLDTKNLKILKLTVFLTPLGFLTSLFLVYLQLFVLNAICLYCIISALTSTSLFVLGGYALLKFSEKESVTEQY